MKARQLWTPLLLLLTLLLPLGQPIAQAQEGEAAAEAPEAYVVPAEHASARDTMRTFLESFGPADPEAEVAPLDVAAACLDLSDIRSSLREHQGRELALQLKEILDRTEFIEVTEISDDPEAEPYRLAVHGYGEVVIAPDERGEWLFDRDTVREIPRLYSDVLDHAVVEGVTEIRQVTTAMWLRSQMPDALLGRSFLLEHWQWLFLGLLLVVGLIIGLDRRRPRALGDRPLPAQAPGQHRAERAEERHAAGGPVRRRSLLVVRHLPPGPARRRARRPALRRPLRRRHRLRVGRLPPGRRARRRAHRARRGLGQQARRSAGADGAQGRQGGDRRPRPAVHRRYPGPAGFEHPGRRRHRRPGRGPGRPRTW